MYTFIQGLELHPFLGEQLHVLVGMVKFWPGSNLIIPRERCKRIFFFFFFAILLSLSINSSKTKFGHWQISLAKVLSTLAVVQKCT